jgi:hypothetical protein
VSVEWLRDSPSNPLPAISSVSIDRQQNSLVPAKPRIQKAKTETISSTCLLPTGTPSDQPSVLPNQPLKKDVASVPTNTTASNHFEEVKKKLGKHDLGRLELTSHDTSEAYSGIRAIKNGIKSSLIHVKVCEMSPKNKEQSERNVGPADTKMRLESLLRLSSYQTLTSISKATVTVDDPPSNTTRQAKQKLLKHAVSRRAFR